MSVLKTLRDVVAPELNHLYTVPPNETPEGINCGWHGREHALHAFFVARMFGATVDVRSGDYAVLSPYLPPLTSVDRPFDHTWCSVNGVAPVDLALTLGCFGQAPQLRTAVVGEGQNGEWKVHYSDDEAMLDEGFGHTNEIIFIEREVHDLSEAALLENPFLLLPATAPDDAKHLSRVHGPGIYAKITLHAYSCATRTAKSLRSRLNRDDAVVWIAENYPDAESQIAKQISAANAK